MITNGKGAWKKFCHSTAVASFVLAVWIALVAAITINAPRDTSFAVFAPAGRAIDVVSLANGTLLNAGRFIAIARSEEPDFVRKLYAAGALLVVDARESGGCTGLPRKPVSAMRL